MPKVYRITKHGGTSQFARLDRRERQQYPAAMHDLEVAVYEVVRSLGLLDRPAGVSAVRQALTITRGMWAKGGEIRIVDHSVSYSMLEA
jgi:hypothetical protein